MMRKSWRFSMGFVLVAVLALVLSACGPAVGPQGSSQGEQTQAGDSSQAQEAQAQKKADAQSFYNGKTVTLIVTTKPGGGFDTYARLVAPLMEKYVAGSSFIVKNVPGAGHVVGMNEMYNAKPDGLTLGHFNPGLIVSQLAELDGVRFDLRKIAWLGSAAQVNRGLIVTKHTPYKSFEDILKAEGDIKLGGGGVGSAAYNDVLFLNAAFGTKLRPIAGYEGAQADMAMLRGEIAGQFGQLDQMIPLVNNGDATLVLQIGVNKDPTLPDVPLAGDIVSEKGRSIVNLQNAITALSRPFAATPGVPADRVKLLREAFVKALSDPVLIERAQTAKIPVNFVNGDEAQELALKALEQPAEVLQLVKEILTKK